MTRAFSALLAPFAVIAMTAAAVLYALTAEGYAPFVLALVALTCTVGVGLNILVGLAGQISLGHVGFYAIGAYAVAILTQAGVDFWLAWPAAGAIAGVVGLLLAIPALRVSGPYLAMVTIAFAFIVQHGATEWRGLTGGANGLMNIAMPSFGGKPFAEREMAVLAVLLAGVSLLFFERLAKSGWGRGMVAVRDSETAARSIGLSPVTMKTAAFALSAVFTGLAGGLFAPLFMFVAPDSFPFSQSILFLLAVIVGGAGWLFGPVLGAAVSVIGPELLSSLAEYRLLFFGAMLLVVLWIAPEGLLGAAARLVHRRDPRAASGEGFDAAAFLKPEGEATALEVSDLSLAFGGVRAAQGIGFRAEPGRVTSVIGPNGAGKTTVLNMIGGFYTPDAGSVRLGGRELAGARAAYVARAGIARTYQTARLFGTMSARDNVMTALDRGAPGFMLADRASTERLRIAEGLLALVGYRGALSTPADDLPHVDRRLVEIARALAMRPRVLLLDEPAAGLTRGDKDALSTLIRRIADTGIAVILVEHDMPLVMGISDSIVVLDAGAPLAAGTPAEVRRDPKVIRAYLGSEVAARPRRAPLPVGETVLSAKGLTAGYGAAPVLEAIDLAIAAGETLAIIGANGAGKSTTMRALSGLLRPIEGAIVLEGEGIARLPAHRIAAKGLALVPEGRQVFPELSVADNLWLGAHTRRDKDIAADIEAMLERFPRLRERLAGRAGLLSGGEQQMLAVARGLMARPRILLLDEPSLGLAPTLVGEVFDILAALRDDGTTILLVDQMAQLALTLADRGMVMESGRVVRAAPAAELVGDASLEAAYLGAAPAKAS